MIRPYPLLQFLSLLGLESIDLCHALSCYQCTFFLIPSPLLRKLIDQL